MQTLQLEAKYAVFDSVDDMLAPESMSRILHHKVSHVTRQRLEKVEGSSDSDFYEVAADNKRLILKITHRSSDWLSLASDDSKARSVRLWQYGLLARLQPHMDHATVAACCDVDDCALLMYDISSGVIPLGQVLTINAACSMLDAFAAMHAKFWGDVELGNPELGLGNTEAFVTAFWPVAFHPNHHDNPGIEKEWGVLLDIVAPDVRAAIQSLLANPQVLFERLAAHPSTLVHGDFRPGNLAILPETNQLIAIDWQLAGYAPAIIDLHWFLTSFETTTPFDGTEYYRRQLAIRLGKRFDPTLWQSMLELGFLAGVLRLGWVHAKHSGAGDGEKVESWWKSTTTFNHIVRQGVEWL